MTQQQLRGSLDLIDNNLELGLSNFMRDVYTVLRKITFKKLVQLQIKEFDRE